MLIVPPNCRSLSFAARSASVPGICELRLVQVVARVTGEKQRNNKSAYPEDQDRHRSAYREAGDQPHQIPRDRHPPSLYREARGARRLGRRTRVPATTERADCLAAHLVVQVPEDVPSNIDARLHGSLLPTPASVPPPPVRTSAILQRMRVLTLVGNRPQFVKAAAVSAHLRERHDEVLVHSGQHYDDELSAVFFRELGLPAPDRELGIGSGDAGEQVAADHARVRAGARRGARRTSCSSTATRTRPSRARSRARGSTVPLAHVESGMRSFDDSMPEERNRVLTDHLSDLLLCSTEIAVDEPRARGRRARASSWSAT